ncbi:lipopolysaccharide biosynthesis protein [Nannocystis punicea]|uniref:Oligosaccharide flippase family protein n=1 Tax=Nannocystis punicea TaxID=2995304 RepID=A0ABY7H1L9_9BACT|nr:oligosaccharide flippase family protein [Nannocystis poenicansa]WAS92959.1 oligosaccharide flippase family protein [Nannocystis poenicansa]
MATDASELSKGGLSLGFAKLFFLLAGYAVSIALTRLVPPGTFGDYTVVSQIIAIPNMVLIQTLLFAVSRPMSAEYDAGLPSYDGLRRRGFRLAGVLGGLVAVIFILGADPLAVHALKDPSLAGALRVVGIIPLIYAAYAVNVGTLNAVRKFQFQAGLDIFMAMTKTTLIIGAAAMGFGLAEILGGFTFASLLAFGLSIVFVSRCRPRTTGGAAGPLPAMAEFTGLLLVFTAGVNLLQALDLVLLKQFTASQAQKDAVGFYSSANLVARVPYSMMNAVSLVMFPLIATLQAQSDRAQIQRYVTATAKVSVFLLCFMSSVGAGAAPEVQRLLFPAAYGEAAGELRLLVWGMSGYSLTVTAAWIFNSTRRSKLALLLIAVPLVVVSAAGLVLVPQSFTSGAATAVAIGGAAGAVASLVALARSLGAALSPVYLLKLLAAVALVEAASRSFAPTGKLLIVVKLALLAVVFLGAVAVTRAVTPAELRELRKKRAP